jgi:antitoxin FitA
MVLALLAYGEAMGAITIRNLDDALVSAIKRRAADHGISMEEEVRQLLASAYSDDRRRRAREWAMRQLERLKRGELPRARVSSVTEIRAMRRERTEHLERISKRSNERRR